MSSEVPSRLAMSAASMLRKGAVSAASGSAQPAGSHAGQTVKQAGKQAGQADGEPSMSSSSSDEDEDAHDYTVGGYHPVCIGDVFRQRYRTACKLGWGHFSTVWLVRDQQVERYGALKIVKSAKHYAEAAMDEVQLLRCVRDKKPGDPGRARVVELFDDFKVVA